MLFPSPRGDKENPIKKNERYKTLAFPSPRGDKENLKFVLVEYDPNSFRPLAGIKKIQEV